MVSDYQWPESAEIAVCTNCNKEKPIVEFMKGSRRCRQCKSCRDYWRVVIAEYRKAHPEVKEWRKRYDVRNRGKQTEQKLQWREDNKEKAVIADEKYYSKAIEYRRKVNREYSIKHRFRRSLYSVNKQARKLGYAECTATVEEITAAFTGYCHNPECKKEELRAVGKSLCLDHCHTTGAFRGWLCGNCNRAIGLLVDSPARIRALAEYVQTAQEKGESDGMAA